MVRYSSYSRTTEVHRWSGLQCLEGLTPNLTFLRLYSSMEVKRRANKYFTTVTKDSGDKVKEAFEDDERLR